MSIVVNIFVYFLLEGSAGSGGASAGILIERMGMPVLVGTIFIIRQRREERGETTDGQTTDLKSSGHKTTCRGPWWWGGGGSAGK